MMAAAVRAKGLPVAYVTFEGEQHGFRKAENIVRALESELYFYGKVFGFTPADTWRRCPSTICRSHFEPSAPVRRAVESCWSHREVAVAVHERDGGGRKHGAPLGNAHSEFNVACKPLADIVAVREESNGIGEGRGRHHEADVAQHAVCATVEQRAIGTQR